MKIIFYTGPQCGLCDLADVELQQTSMFSSLVIEKVNIRTSTELYHLYGARIPVLKRADNEKEIGWPFSAADLEEFLQ
ncbi:MULTISPECIES: glutaredoxin family protein [Alteromonas]|uniref:Thiol-disulfide isomerase n=1 Tax=Alteromonas macleodii TaxID=28108 RepID=A0A6T9Y1K2_ALTMA|nr:MULTISPECIES: glutaredoxin family protein [Alteromonas]MCZ8529272.1 glutaredoxin family protein [Alteromonas sp. PRIM-21]CAB9494039.1 Thiol-disulfide isomerase [Alteromonas macleodii]|tara:strand:- start:692 stop:925 length:234 start_codon:yes stop_codon:yes gene_type:complete